MSVSVNWGPFKKGSGLHERALGFMEGGFRDDLYENDKAVGVDWGAFQRD